MPRLNIIFIITVIIGLSGLTLPAKPLRAHSEHYDNTSEEQLNEASEVPQDMPEDMPEDLEEDMQEDLPEDLEEQSDQPSEPPKDMHQEIQAQPETLTSQTSEASTKTLSATSSAQFNLTPQPAELVFLWLVANPFLLFLVKNRIYSQDVK